jgi:membrane-associated phospholipid phosphatase
LGLDLWLLQRLNEWVARSPGAFYEALALVDRPPWVIAACALIALWFAGRAGPVEVDAPRTSDGRLSRRKAQSCVILTFAAMVVAFVIGRVLQVPFNRFRPLAIEPSPLSVPIDPEIWARTQAALGSQGSFPSDHAVMFFTLVTGTYALSRWAGLVAAIIALYLSALRVGVGFHWPSDILGGAVLGSLAAVLLLALARHLRWATDPVLAAFDRYPVVAYPLAFLILLDFSQKLITLFTILARLKDSL